MPYNSGLLFGWSGDPVWLPARLFLPLKSDASALSRSRCGICSLHSGGLLEEPHWYFINPADWPDGRKLQRIGLHSRSWRCQGAEPKGAWCHLHEPRWAAESGAAELCSRYQREWCPMTRDLRGSPEERSGHGLLANKSSGGALLVSGWRRDSVSCSHLLSL